MYYFLGSMATYLLSGLRLFLFLLEGFFDRKIFDD